MEYFGNLSSPCPLHEQPKDEIIFLGTPCTMQLVHINQYAYTLQIYSHAVAN